VFNRRIFFGVVVTWFLLEGAKGVWKVWGQIHSGQPGLVGTIADDVLQVTS
jgi:hypothetical protein